MIYLILNVSTEDEHGPFLASVALTADLLDNLQKHVEGFRGAQAAYLSLYAAESFDYSLEYYEEPLGTDEYDSEEEAQLAAALFDYDDATSPISTLDTIPEGAFCLVDANKLPASGGNVRTECNSLHLSHASPCGDTVELWWTCFLKHTSCELRTVTITSKNLEEWAALLAAESK